VRSRRSIRHRATLLLLVPLLLGAATTSPPRRDLAAPLPGHSDRASLAYAEAAAAVRRKDCGAAYKALAPVLAGKSSEATFAQLLLGFYAHSCEQTAYAEERLFAAADPDGPLEDWRLYLLSDSAAARGHILLAQTSLARLLGDYPGSALRPRALLKAATVAWQRGDAPRALELIAAGRSEDLRGTEAAELESLAWEIGTQRADRNVQVEAARRLLVNFPFKAAELKVIEIFRDPGGAVNWPAVLTGDQLKRRAQALLDLRLDPSALTTLDVVTPEARDLRWYLLEAQALTRSHRGSDALALLEGREAQDARQAAALAWARAQAADDAATAQRGRANLGSAERQQLRLLARQHLEKAAQGADAELAAKALKSLYADYREDDLFDRAIDALRRLRRLDARDTTGASNLWQAGWQEYSRRNHTGAIGYWTELFSLYPEDSNARRGRYWTARAFDDLGERERAQQIYSEIARADTTDFYRRNALTRLLGKPAALAAVAAGAQEPWPADPALERARLLTDLGLDDLALSETELVREKVERQPALKALEAVILARRGERRKSVQVIRDAFPALGGPFQATLPEEARRLYYPIAYQEPIRTWAATNRLPTYLVFGIIRQESAFDPTARSWAGARGLMQLMPATARELALKNGLSYSHDLLADPAFNVRLGTTYFRQVYSMFDENLELSLAGYNGGPYRIKRLWRESSGTELDRFLEGLGLEEPKTYVKRILVLSDSYRQLYPQAG